MFSTKQSYFITSIWATIEQFNGPLIGYEMRFSKSDSTDAGDISIFFSIGQL